MVFSLECEIHWDPKLIKQELLFIFPLMQQNMTPGNLQAYVTRPSLAGEIGEALATAWGGSAEGTC